MDEQMYDESEVTPSKKKKKSKKRKHEESERVDAACEEQNGEDQQQSGEEPKSKGKSRKSKSSKREEAKRTSEKSYAEPNAEEDSDPDDLFQQESIQLDGNEQLDEEASYDFGQQEDEERSEEPADEENRATQKSDYQCEPFSCVEQLHRRIKFPLLPTVIGQELQVITQTLVHKWKYNYINELNGFLYYFQNLKLVKGTYGRIMDDLPYYYCDITADFYVFRPKLGEYLKATISW